MNHFINLKDISATNLRKIITDAKKRKDKRKNFNTLDVDKDKPLKGKLLIQMFAKFFYFFITISSQHKTITIC